jgi:phage replication O-like protein O
MPRAQNSPQVEDGYIRIANSLLEAILAFGFTQRELLVLMAIMRKTYGFNKKADDMSASQIAALCNMARSHVTATLGSLAGRNVITKTVGRFGSVIGIQKNHRLWISQDLFKGSFAGTDSVQGGTDSVQVGGTDSVQGEDGGENEGNFTSEASSFVPEPAPLLDSDGTDSVHPGTNSVHVPIRCATGTDSVQVGGTDSVHTKDTIPKDTKQKTSSSSSDDDVRLCPVGSLVNLYHELLPKNPKVLQVTEARKKSIRARWGEAATLEVAPFGYETKAAGLEAWRSFFAYCAKSDFMTGRVPGRDGKKPFRAGLDFLFSPAGFAKTLEGLYHDGVVPGHAAASSPQADGESWRQDPRFRGGK